MTQRTITICDACGRDIFELGKMWEIHSPWTLVPTHFHGLKCMGEFIQRELAKPKVVPLRPKNSPLSEFKKGFPSDHPIQKLKEPANKEKDK